MPRRFICPHCHSPVDPDAMDSAAGPSAHYRICPVCDEAVLIALAPPQPAVEASAPSGVAALIPEPTP